MKYKLLIIGFLFFNLLCAQNNRVEQIKNNIERLLTDVPGLSQKVNVNIKEATLPSFLLAVSEVHKVNISVDPSLNKILLVNNFTNVTVGDLIVFLCKEYNLNVDFTGSILAIKKYDEPVAIPEKKRIDVGFQPNGNLLSLNLKDDKLYEAFKEITDKSGRNIVFAPGLENKLLTVYIKSMPFDDALDKLALANNLVVSKTKDNFYLFESSDDNATVTGTNTNGNNTQRPSKPLRSRKSNFFFAILDADRKLLEVDFENTPISNIIYDIGNELNIDMFISTPLESAGTATVKAKNITFDELLVKIFESSNSGPSGGQSTQSASSQNQTIASGSEEFTYFKKNNIYFFGLKNQLVVRNIKRIAMMHRSIELLSDPSKEGGRSAGRVNNQNNFTSFNNQNANPLDNNSISNNRNSSYTQPVREDTSRSQGDIMSIIPDEIKNGLDIKIDTELNSFIVSGPAENIVRFESFIDYIDKEVPVVLIEVMIIEVSRSATVETGINAGIGDKPATTKGTVFPTSDITLGAQTINNIINHFDGFGSLNIGKVVPNFYVSLKALETNGNINIRSTPR
ncbi:MAG TPA: hypothetical protein VF677_12710, partial [Flavobacterium sp.]